MSVFRLVVAVLLLTFNVFALAAECASGVSPVYEVTFAGQTGTGVTENAACVDFASKFSGLTADPVVDHVCHWHNGSGAVGEYAVTASCTVSESPSEPSGTVDLFKLVLSLGVVTVFALGFLAGWHQ